MTVRTWTGWLGARDDVSLSDGIRALVARHGIWATWLVPAIYVGCLAAFLADLTSADTVAFGVFYIPLVATAVFHRNKHAVWVLTAIACVMVVVGAFVPSIAADLRGLIWNRALSLCAVLATAMFVWHARSIQDQLLEQTDRAEAAERIKAEVLTNLSEEIRAPLHSMIGVLELVAVDSRPDQRAALGMVRGAGRRLVSTIDNLVDLTQFDERSISAEPLDLGALLRQTAEAGSRDASARQISLSIDIPLGGDAMVQANPWAARRILENKIADAIAYTAPGGRIAISTATESGHISAVIAGTSKWPPGALQQVSDPEVTPLMPSVMGVALSQRLARAMHGRLLFSSGPEDGTTVRLRLPAAASSQGAHM